MSSAVVRVCRLCRRLVPSKNAINIFSPSGIQQQWSSRISNMLDTPISQGDGLSPCVCEVCKRRLVSLEKSVVDLKDFRELVRNSRSALERLRGPLKRSKETSGSVVSPDTSRARPRSKRRLQFNCKDYYYIPSKCLNSLFLMNSPKLISD